MGDHGGISLHPGGLRTCPLTYAENLARSGSLPWALGRCRSGMARSSPRTAGRLRMDKPCCQLPTPAEAPPAFRGASAAFLSRLLRAWVTDHQTLRCAVRPSSRCRTRASNLWCGQHGDSTFAGSSCRPNAFCGAAMLVSCRMSPCLPTACMQAREAVAHHKRWNIADVEDMTDTVQKPIRTLSTDAVMPQRRPVQRRRSSVA